MTTTLNAWEQPSDYAGYNPVGHLGVIAKHRECIPENGGRLDEVLREGL